jgi:nitrate/TMAO reductase-like tetraheme cytochrome c subunit
MRLRTVLFVTGLMVCLVSFGFAVSEAAAGPGQIAEAAVQSSASLQADDGTCLTCHNKEGFTVKLDGGETLSLTISSDAFNKSIHGSNGLTCVTCHLDIEGFPHPKRTTDTIRDVKLKYYTSCQQCHAEQFTQTLDSVHQRSLAAGNKNAAVCADCHNPHTQQRITGHTGTLLPSARLQIPETCAKCHSTIYETYKKSVHGKALTEDNNADVPTCIDCHGVHNIQDPTTATFRNSTPYLCAKCHTDKTIMEKYGLSTEVLNTYVADFHGTTVVLFDNTFPDQPTNKPVCTDCHGFHDVARGDDPEKGLSVRKNLLARCQKCHPDATENFPDSWLSHYIPSPEKYASVYYINLVYKFFIPAVLVPMAILVVMDFSRKMINRYRKPKPTLKKQTAPKAKKSKSADEESLND